jgi:hypothetical protein
MELSRAELLQEEISNVTLSQGRCKFPHSSNRSGTTILRHRCRRRPKVIDIPNAFIQTRVEDEKDMAVIKIRGVLVDMLVKIAPEVYGTICPLIRKE